MLSLISAMSTYPSIYVFHGCNYSAKLGIFPFPLKLNIMKAAFRRCQTSKKMFFAKNIIRSM
jgi:hypothetical protein